MSKTITLKMPEVMRAKVNKVSERLGWSKSLLVRTAIAEFLETKGGK